MSGNFRQRTDRFMQGRYGADRFFRFQLIAALVLFCLGWLSRSGLLQLPAWALLLWGLWRALPQYRRPQPGKRPLPGGLRPGAALAPAAVLPLAGPEDPPLFFLSQVRQRPAGAQGPGPGDRDLRPLRLAI